MNSLLANLAGASSAFNLAPGAVGFANGDLMVRWQHGQVEKARQFLRLRLAIHLSNANATKAASEAAAAVAAAGGVFTSNADNASSCTSRPRQIRTQFTVTPTSANRDDSG